MLARRSRSKSIKADKAGSSTSSNACRFYWHRPLGAAANCRRLTVVAASKNNRSRVSWALHLSMDQVLVEISKQPRHLDTVELSGCSYEGLTDNEWEQLCDKICSRQPRQVMFQGNGLSDTQRSFLLQRASHFVQAVQLSGIGYAQHDKTLSTAVSLCFRLAELRLVDCAALSQQETDWILHLMMQRHSPTLTVLEILRTDWYNPLGTARAVCAALEDIHAAAALTHADFGTLFADDEEMKDYLNGITKLNCMRHYYHHMRQHTDLSAFSVADNALAVVQHWWQLTHRPHRHNDDDAYLQSRQVQVNAEMKSFS